MNPNNSPEKGDEPKLLRPEILAIYDQLTGYEKGIFAAIFGLDEEPALSNKEVMEKFRITIEELRNLRARWLSKQNGA